MCARTQSVPLGARENLRLSSTITDLFRRDSRTFAQPSRSQFQPHAGRRDRARHISSRYRLKRWNARMRHKCSGGGELRNGKVTGFFGRPCVHTSGVLANERTNAPSGRASVYECAIRIVKVERQRCRERKRNNKKTHEEGNWNIHFPIIILRMRPAIV